MAAPGVVAGSILRLTNIVLDESPFYQYLWWLLIASVGLGAVCLAFALRNLPRYGFILQRVYFCSVGVFDAITWDGGLFHSYITNIRFNLVVDAGRAGETPGYQFLWWLLLASVGLSAQVHKEYRYIFAVIPLWLLLGADVVARLSARVKRPRYLLGLFAALFAAVSLGGILNALPSHDQVYRAYSKETGKVQFIRDHDPVFAAYRYLAHAPGVLGVWHADRPYFNLPGYYYLHHKIPFYDFNTGRMINTGIETTLASVSHIVAEDPNVVIPDYTVVKQFGALRIWRRDDNEAPIRQWEVYNPIISGVEQIMKIINPNAPTPPDNMGIKYGER